MRLASFFCAAGTFAFVAQCSNAAYSGDREVDHVVNDDAQVHPNERAVRPPAFAPRFHRHDDWEGQTEQVWPNMTNYITARQNEMWVAQRRPSRRYHQSQMSPLVDYVEGDRADREVSNVHYRIYNQPWNNYPDNVALVRIVSVSDPVSPTLWSDLDPFNSVQHAACVFLAIECLLHPFYPEAAMQFYKTSSDMISTPSRFALGMLLHVAIVVYVLYRWFLTCDYSNANSVRQFNAQTALPMVCLYGYRLGYFVRVLTLPNMFEALGPSADEIAKQFCAFVCATLLTYTVAFAVFSRQFLASTQRTQEEAEAETAIDRDEDAQQDGPAHMGHHTPLLYVEAHVDTRYVELSQRRRIEPLRVRSATGMLDMIGNFRDGNADVPNTPNETESTVDMAINGNDKLEGVRQRRMHYSHCQ